jgi:hypothetical protein
MPKTYPPLKDLRTDGIEAKSQDFDWQDNPAEDIGDDKTGTPWSFVEAVECETCGGVVVLDNGGGNEEHKDVQHEDDDGERITCEGYVSLAEGPMMSYWYPVGISDVHDAARAIADLPLCVVTVGGQTGLALTGGGMDLSWEICEAFIRIGQLPPSSFSDLPGMAGRGTSPRDRYIMRACLKTFDVQIQWLKNGRKAIADKRAFVARHLCHKCNGNGYIRTGKDKTERCAACDGRGMVK